MSWHFEAVAKIKEYKTGGSSHTTLLNHIVSLPRDLVTPPSTPRSVRYDAHVNVSYLLTEQERGRDVTVATCRVPVA